MDGINPSFNLGYECDLQSKETHLLISKNTFNAILNNEFDELFNKISVVGRSRGGIQSLLIDLSKYEGHLNFKYLHKIYVKEVKRLFPAIVTVELVNEKLKILFKTTTAAESCKFEDECRTHFNRFAQYLKSFAVNRRIDNVDPDYANYVLYKNEIIQENYAVVEFVAIDNDSMVVNGANDQIVALMNTRLLMSKREIRIEQDQSHHTWLSDMQERHPEVVSYIANQIVYIYGPTESVQRVVESCEQYMATKRRAIDALVVLIDKSLCPIVHAITKNERFKQHFEANIGRYTKDNFIEAREVLMGLEMLIVNSDNCVEEAISGFQEYVNQWYNSHDVNPLVGNYPNLTTEFLEEVQSLIVEHFQLDKNELYILEMKTGFVYKDHQQNVHHWLPAVLRRCYTFSTFDISAALRKPVKFELNLQSEDYLHYLRSHADWLFLVNAFKRVPTSSVLHSDSQFEGELSHIAFLKVAVKSILSKVHQLVYYTDNWPNLNENQALIEKIMRTSHNRNFCVRIKSNKLVYLYSDSKGRLNEAKRRLDVVRNNYISKEVDAEGTTYVATIHRHREKIDRKFDLVNINLDDAANNIITVQGYFSQVNDFCNCWLVDYSSEKDLSHIPDSFFNTLAMPTHVTSVLPKIFFGHLTTLHHIETQYAIHCDLQADIAPRVKWKPGEYKEVRFNKFNFKRIEAVVEMESKLLECLFLNYPDYVFETCYLTSEIVCYMPTSCTDDNVDTLKSDLMSYLSICEKCIPILCIPVIYKNIAFFKKLMERLKSWKLEKELEFGQKIYATFEIDTHGRHYLYILGSSEQATSYLYSGLIENTWAKINFDTSLLTQTNVLEKLNKFFWINNLQGYGFEVHEDDGQIYFKGHVFDYFCFNILFEQMMFWQNYEKPDHVFSFRLGYYARVFSCWLADFIQSLPVELKDCRCEIRAFNNELVIQPSLNLLLNAENEDAFQQYKESLRDFLTNRMHAREIQIPHGLDADYVADFVKVLNAEIRHGIERRQYEPLVVFAKEALNERGNIELYGLKRDVDFVAKRLDEVVTRYKHVTLVPNDDALLQQLFQRHATQYPPTRNVFQLRGRLVDVILIQMLLDVKQSGRFVTIELTKLNQSFFLDLDEHRDRWCESKNYKISCNLERSQIEFNVRAKGSLKNESKKYNQEAHLAVLLGVGLKRDFYAKKFLDDEIKELFIHKLLEYGVLAIELKSKEIIFCYNGIGANYEEKISFSKPLSGGLCIRGLQSLHLFAESIHRLKDEIQETKSQFILITNAYQTELYANGELIDVMFMKAYIETLIRRVEVYVYRVSRDIYDHVLYEMFPQFIPQGKLGDFFPVGFEYMNGHMMVYSLDKIQLKLVKKRIEEYLRYED